MSSAVKDIRNLGVGMRSLVTSGKGVVRIEGKKIIYKRVQTKDEEKIKKYIKEPYKEW